MAKRKSVPDVVTLPAPKRDWRYWVRLITGDNVSGLVKLLIAFLVFQWLLIQQFSIPSGSMEPTLHGDPRFLRGDRVLVNKWLYGTRIPFTNHRFFDYKDPQRWDIVVFNSVQDNAEHGVLIKRVVGLPGEHVLIGEDGRIVVNGTPVDPPEELKDVLHYTRKLVPPEEAAQGYMVLLALLVPDSELRKLPDAIRNDFERIRERMHTRNLRNVAQYNELPAPERAEIVAGVGAETLDLAKHQLSLDYNQQVSREKPFRYGIVDEPEYSVVPDGHYFVLGDNSGNSVDGRFFGWLPKGNILGRAASIWWPFTRMRDFTGWTDTLWGKAIVWGIPLGWIGYEICVAFFFCSWRVRRSALGPVQPGDHVWINRIALGFRLPFTARRVTPGREIRDGEYVLARAPDTYDGFAIGRVQRDNKPGAEIPVSFSEDGKSAFRVPRAHVVGVVTSVWWPVRRRTRIAASPGQDA